MSAGADAYGVGYGIDSNRQSMATRSSDDTVVASRHQSDIPSPPPRMHPTEEVEDHRPMSTVDLNKEVGQFAPVKPANTEKEQRPLAARQITEEDVVRHLSRRNSTRSGGGELSKVSTQASAAELAEIDRLMSRMFGKTRQAQSEEEQTRHKGVVWKRLTVKGMGLGAALQPTFGDVFVGLPRLAWNMVTKGPRKAVGKPPVRTILDDFSGVIRPGEMCLVLGRPG